MHQCRCTQAVCTVVREVSFTDSEETLDRSHQFVVNPNTTHCIVDSREDHHRSLIWIFVCNFFVHVEQVTVTSTNYVFAQAVDSVLEVQEYSQTCIVHTVTSVATFLSSTRSHVTRNQVTECRVTAFQVEVTVFVRNVCRLLRTSLESLSVFQLLRNPDTTVVTQRFRHQSQLRLLVTVYRYTSRVNLSETWVSEVSTLTVALHSSRTVTAHSVSRQEVSVTITTSTDYYSVSSETFDLTSNQVTSQDTTSTFYTFVVLNQYYIQHFVASVQLHVTTLNFAAQCRVSTQQQLLTGLTAGIECTGYLSTTE